MVRYRKRRNPARRKKSRSKARRSRSRARRPRRSRAKRSRRVAGKRHRVTLYKSRSGWSRGRITRRSVMRGKGPIRVNPSRRRRRNPGGALLSSRGLIPTKGFALQAAAIVGGFIAGNMLKPYYSRIPFIGDPSSMIGRVGPGALNLVVGALAAKKLKGVLKPVGIGIAASGVASILSNFFPTLSLAADLGADLGYDGGVVQVGDEVVRVSGDDAGGDDVYERI